VSARPTKPDDRLLEAVEVAELLSVKESWVRDHTRSGDIPHVALGRYVRYRREDVLAWVDELAARRPVAKPVKSLENSTKEGGRRSSAPARGTRR
jgi:excisionase family DNA binding protein